MVDLLLLPFLLMAAAGTRAEPASSSVQLKLSGACSIVSRMEVEQALGRFVDKGSEEAGRLRSTCDYQSRNGIVTITIQRLTEELNLKTEKDALKAAFPAATLRKVEGIGSEALFLDMPDAGAQLHVIQDGRYYVLISVLGFGKPSEVAPAVEKIAHKVLDRL